MCRRRVLPLGVAATVVLLARLSGPALARAPGDPIRLVWDEGDIAGTTTVWGPEGGPPIGFVEYHQRRQGDVLSSLRVSRFADGSSDEDTAEARVAGTLEALRGRSIIRDTHGETIVDLTIDVTAGRLTGSWGLGDARHTIDEKVDLPRATYWGPLVFLVLKSFDANQQDGRLVFRTVAPTPKPVVIDLELVRMGPSSVRRTGGELTTTRIDLRPTIHWAVDPVVRLIAPATHFDVLPGEPPALARFLGPRNYAGQRIRIE